MTAKIFLPKPRAIKLTHESVGVIAGIGMDLDMPPHVDHLLDAAGLPVDYYFVINYPGSDHVISWVLIPDFIFHEKFRFAAKESKTQLISVIKKHDS